MGKMKALCLDMEENYAQEDQEEDSVISLQQEAHYHHVIEDVCELFVLHGWDKVWPDIQETMRARK